MPVILRVATDMFEFSDVMSYMVNPVNLMGRPGAGLALEFRKRIPDDKFFTPYQEACKTKELRIGTIQVIEDTGEPWGVINFPTKRHFYDDSLEEDIVRGLEALRDFLTQDKFRYSSVGMPMLGCGLGKQSYDTVYPLMIDHLSDLEATVFLSMAPDKTEMRPRYLTIAGPLDWGNKPDERDIIDSTIDKVMASWGTSLSDYTGIVSGGYPGVDAYICGENFRKDEHKTYVHKKTGQTPLVVKPNSPRNGIGSNLHLGNLLCEIGDDIILFKPKGHNNNRLSAMQAWLQADKERRDRDGLIQKRVAIFGDKARNPVPESVLVPETDIPY